MLLDILTNNKFNIKRIVVAESRAIYGEGKYWSAELQRYVYPECRQDSDMQKGNFNVYYGNSKNELKLVATTEDSLIHPTSIYGITKQVQGQLVHLICPAIGIDDVSLRYQNVYGPGQSLTNPYTGILSIFSTQIKNHHTINIFEDGTETRDFIYINDVVDSTILALLIPAAKGHSFNIGTGVPTDVLTIAKTLCQKYSITVPIKISGNYRLGDIRHNFADITLASKILGFKPKVSLDRGLAKFAEWVNTQEVQKDNYEVSINEMKSKGLYK